MKLRDPKVVLALLSLCAVAWLLLRDLERTSPGGLAAAHAQEAQLTEGGSCDLCHGARGETMRSACSSCHADIEAQIASGTGLHGAALDVDFADCGACHLEHRDDTFPLVAEQSFARAGFASRAAFDHSVVAFGLEGKHAELDCVACHANADALVLSSGTKRFLDLDQGCDTCHEDVHGGRMQRECAACHGQSRPFAQVASFQHRTVSLAGAHAGLACIDCHTPDGPHAVTALAGPSPTDAVRACADCHASPHAPDFTAAGCADCHAADHGTFAGNASAMPVALHAASGVALIGGHADVACERCHTGATYAARFPRRAANACEACHADPHDGQFEDQRCAACHDVDGFAPSAFGVEAHARTSLPLTDRHAEIACSACHVAPHDAAPVAFRGLESDCASCHADAHRALLAAPAEAGCAACHVPTRFADVDVATFDHARFARFELSGAHARADCEACHTRSTQPDEAGRTFGFAADLASGPVSACASCHADAHAGAFAAADCAECHGTDSFRAEHARFDHARAGFTLAGAHAALACEACHARSPVPDAFGRTFGRAAALDGALDSCATCHADPHRGVFAARGEQAGCAACHSSESFRELRAPFDHARWTDYALSPEHDALACAACHVGDPSVTTTERPVVGRACGDCHADPHAGQFAVASPDRLPGEEATDCARCHVDTGGLRFDHDRDSRFPLDAKHAGLACAACHVSWPLADGREVTRYRPLGTECADCHGPARRGGG